MALQFSTEDWLVAFAATLTVILGDNLVEAHKFTWRFGGCAIIGKVIATEPAVMQMITIDVAHLPDEPPKMRFYFHHRDDPFSSAQKVARWLHMMQHSSFVD